MKRWCVKYTRDGEHFFNDVVEAESYTEAYVKFEVAHSEGDCIQSIELTGGCV